MSSQVQKTELSTTKPDVEMLEQTHTGEMEKVHTGYINDDPNRMLKKSALERRLLLKTDILTMTILSFTLFVNSWDRNNIGNARIMGLQQAIGLTDSDFYNSLSLYYVGYVIFMLPAVVFIRHLKANRQIGGCCIAFAVLSTCMAASKNAATILALRFFIGVASVFLQGISVYTSMWYKRDEIATRGAVYYSAATIAGGFGGFVSYGIQSNLDGALGYPDWFWLFVIQGCAGIFVGLVGWFGLPLPPDQIKDKKHWYYTPEEIDLAISRLQTYNVVGAKFEAKQIWVALKDPKTTLFSLMNSGIAIALISLSSFLPTFINQFGFSPVRAQLFSIIPYACAFVMVLATCLTSDYINVKGPFLMLALGTSALGYIVLLAVTDVKVKIFGSCLVAMGCFTSVVLLGSWLNINTGGYTKRASTWAITEIFGQCFAILGTHVYTDPPRFIKGHSILLGFTLLALVCCIVNWFYMRHLNKQKDAEERDRIARGEVHSQISMTLEEVFDQHPSFRYVL